MWLSEVKESAYIAEDLGMIPGLGRCPGEGKGYPLQYSGLENFLDCIVHGVTKSQTRLKRLSSSSSIGQHIVQRVLCGVGQCSATQPLIVRLSVVWCGVLSVVERSAVKWSGVEYGRV